MTIIEDLLDDDVWDTYLDRRTKGVVDDMSYSMAITTYIRNRRYRPMVEALSRGEYKFSDPIMMEVDKGNGKTRTVYTFRKNDLGEHLLICIMANLLGRYDSIFAPNLYSAKKSDSVYDVVQDLLKIEDLDKKYFFKLDFSDYGNSIDCDLSIEIMRKKIPSCDSAVVDIIESILRNPNVISLKKVGDRYVRERIVKENKGSMAGLAISTFLCNIYLSEMDWHFYLKGIPYVRFFDDVLVVADNEEEIQSYKDYMLKVAAEKKLIVNDDKMTISAPGEYLKHLGLEIHDGQIGITPDVVLKKKKQMKSKARYYNIKARNGEISRENAMKMFIDYTNRSFYNTKFQWSFTRTYFPRITTSRYLSDIDEYVQECIRFVYVGKFRDSNKCKVSYDMMRENGYVPLMSAYRMFREGGKSKPLNKSRCSPSVFEYRYDGCDIMDGM